MTTNRKLKSGVEFGNLTTYNYYQCLVIKWRISHGHSETAAMQWYISTGLAKAFEAHHRTHSDANLVVTSIGQQIVAK